MKIVLINKSSDKGGASIACNRLLEALNKTNVDAKLVVQEYNGGNKNLIISTTTSRAKRYLNFVRFVWERLCFLPYEKSKEVRFAFSLANTGEDISKIKAVKDADIIHLHWFNQGYLSLKSLSLLFQLGKPIVWTMHDMWAFTGGCHYAGSCMNYTGKCGDCNYLRFTHKLDLSHSLNIKKEKKYYRAPLTFVGCSRWMADKATESSLLQSFKVINIPNPIDTELFSPKDKLTSRKLLGLPLDKKILLFGAANVLDKRKGLDYLLQSLEMVGSKYPGLAKNMHCVVFGRAKQPFTVSLPATYLSYVSSPQQLVELYSASDVFVLPSLQDNLPNTVMEAMSCSIPVVAFNTGGLPEMIDHRINGYLAILKNISDMVEGLNFILSSADYGTLQKNARKKILENYRSELIAEKYIELYNKLLNNH